MDRFTRSTRVLSRLGLNSREYIKVAWVPERVESGGKTTQRVCFHGTDSERTRTTEFVFYKFADWHFADESAARCAGNCRDGERRENGGRERKARTLFGNNADCFGIW